MPEFSVHEIERTIFTLNSPTISQMFTDMIRDLAIQGLTLHSWRYVRATEGIGGSPREKIIAVFESDT